MPARARASDPSRRRRPAPLSRERVHLSDGSDGSALVGCGRVACRPIRVRAGWWRMAGCACTARSVWATRTASCAASTTGVPFLHDAAVKIGLPLLQQAGGRESSLRRFPGGAHGARPTRGRVTTGSPPRVLEVSIGTGGNLRWMRDRAPRDTEWWGLDLSRGMLRLARRRVDRLGMHVRMVQGDAHGAAVRGPQLRPGDARGRHQRLSRHRGRAGRDGSRGQAGHAHRGGGRAARREPSRGPVSEGHVQAWSPFYDDDPRSPVDKVPDDAIDVRDEQASRFFYCLSYRMPS